MKDAAFSQRFFIFAAKMQARKSFSFGKTANPSAVPSLAHALHKWALSQNQRKPADKMYGFERF